MNQSLWFGPEVIRGQWNSSMHTKHAEVWYVLTLWDSPNETQQYL